LSALIIHAWNWQGRSGAHAAAVSRYDALKRGINGASETVVIDVSIFTGSCRVGMVMAKFHFVLRQAPRISTRVRIWANRKFSLYPTESNLGALAALAGGSLHSWV
jgi:hypothetical protein